MEVNPKRIQHLKLGKKKTAFLTWWLRGLNFRRKSALSYYPAKLLLEHERVLQKEGRMPDFRGTCEWGLTRFSDKQCPSKTGDFIDL